MPVEGAVNGIQDLNPSWPLGTDPKNQGDDHIRNTKAAVQGSFPNMLGPNDIGATLKAAGFNAGDEVISNVATPAAASDAATKGYVDGQVTAVDTGHITSVGGIAKQFGGGFTVSRLGQGIYQIDFTITRANQTFVATGASGNFTGISCNWQEVDDNTYIVRTAVYYDAQFGFGSFDLDFNFVRHSW